jgi:hypothetical protein
MKEHRSEEMAIVLSGCILGMVVTLILAIIFT